VIRVFPNAKDPGHPPTKWTPRDELAFYGDPPLMLPPQMPVRISVTFSWDRSEGERLFRSWQRFYPDVQIGGPAYDDPGSEFMPGLFVKPGVVVTSRGCPKHCNFCLVPRREGKIRELPIRDGWNLFDNNLLACSRDHIEAVFDMLQQQPEPILFTGGFDKKLLRPWHIDLLKTISLKRIYFACDSESAFPALERAADLLADFSREKRYCYVLVNYYPETSQEAEARLIRVFRLGFMPFAMYYRGPLSGHRAAADPAWRKLIRKWTNPARLKAFMKSIDNPGDLRA